MSWLTPSTRTTGEMITASIWNQDVKDNPISLRQMPAALAYNSANIAITTATETYLTFDSERFDNDTVHDLVTNTGRLTCKTAGVYHVLGNVQFEGSATGIRYLKIRLNGTTVIAAIGRQTSDSTGAVNSTEAPVMQISALYKLAVNDYLELGVYHSHGSNRNVQAIANWSPNFGMAWQTEG